MKRLFGKNFKKILSVCVSLNIFTSCIVSTPVNAHIDSDDEFAIYDNLENDLIVALYDTIDNLHIPLNSTGVSLNVVIPSCLINVAHKTFHAQESDDEAQKYEHAQRCTSYFPIILKALCDKGFDCSNPFNTFRVISIASILCILYDAGYVRLAGHMIYILSCFRRYCAMIGGLIDGDEDTWEFVSWHICYYNADSLLSTARELCKLEF